MTKLKLRWEKIGLQVAADVGESGLSVRRFGRKGAYHWRVLQVFGVAWQDPNDYLTAEQAMAAAELLAESVLASITDRFTRRRGRWRLRSR